MARRRRIDLPGLTHHVTSRGVDRQQVFFDDADRVAFGRAIDHAHRQFGITVLAYCLMDNHYHLLVRCDDAVLSRSMQSIGSRFAHDTNRRQGRDGHLFGARFFSTVVDTHTYRLSCQRYIERNSLAIPGITSPSDYRWSSVRANLGMKRRPDWLASEQVLSWFSSVDSYRHFIEDEPSSSPPHTMSIHQLDGMIGSTISLHSDRTTSRTHRGRTVLNLLSTRLSDVTRQDALVALGLDTPRSIREATARAERRASDDPTIWTVVNEVESWICDQPTITRSAA